MPADPAGAAQEENLLLLRITTAAGLMLLLMYVFVCVCVYVVSECAPTRRLPPTSPGKERSALLFLSSPLAAARVEAQLRWMDCCCSSGWLWLDLLAISRTLCSSAVSGVMLLTLPDFAGKKKTGMERSGPTPSASRRAGWRQALRELHRRSTCCYASPHQRSLRLSPPTSGLARSMRRRRRGAQLDWEFAF